MNRAVRLGKINIKLLEEEFGKITTDEVIINYEQLAHIQKRHPCDYELFREYASETVRNPDIIIKDCKNKGTVFMVKRIGETNLNAIVRLVLVDDDQDYLNSVMTFYRIRTKNLIKLKNKNKILYKSE